MPVQDHQRLAGIVMDAANVRIQLGGGLVALERLIRTAQFHQRVPQIAVSHCEFWNQRSRRAKGGGGILDAPESQVRVAQIVVAVCESRLEGQRTPIALRSLLVTAQRLQSVCERIPGLGRCRPAGGRRAEQRERRLRFSLLQAYDAKTIKRAEMKGGLLQDGREQRLGLALPASRLQIQGSLKIEIYARTARRLSKSLWDWSAWPGHCVSD